MNPANLINGQKPEFGNPAHIRYIKEMQRLAELKERGVATVHSANLEEKITYDFYIRFTCLNCGSEQKEKEYDLDEDSVELIDVTCRKCRQRYEYNPEDEELKIKK